MDDGCRQPYKPSSGLVVVVLYGIFWFSYEPITFDWYAVATLIVWTTIFIQRADRRVALAVHAKFDERETHALNSLQSTKENLRPSRKFAIASGARLRRDNLHRQGRGAARIFLFRDMAARRGIV